MRIFRTRVGMKAVLAIVALFALLFWAIRFSRDQRPSNLYAGWLQTGNDSRRLEAAEALGRGQIDAAIAIPALVRALLTDRDSAVRRRAADSLANALSQFNDGSMDSEAERALVIALSDSDAAVRTAAASTLGRIHPDSSAVVEALLKATTDTNEWVRGSAVAALGLIEKQAKSSSAEAKNAIVKAMNDKSHHLREMGFYAFWAVAEKSPELSIALLKSDDVHTRRSVVAACAVPPPRPRRSLKVSPRFSAMKTRSFAPTQSARWQTSGRRPSPRCLPWRRHKVTQTPPSVRRQRRRFLT